MDMSHGRPPVVLACGVLAGVAIGCGGSVPSASPSADPRSRAAPAASPPAQVACTRADVEGLVTRFVAAFSRGDERDLDGLFAPKSDFRWYSTDGPGRRLRAAAEDRGTLIAYFRRRHRAGERLRLRSVRCNGGTPAYGNFEYEVVRRVGARAPRAYAGQNGAPSYASGIDVPRPGCWRLSARTAGLSASVIVRAVAGRSPSRAPVSATPARVAGRVRYQALAEG